MVISDENITSSNFWLNVGAETVYNAVQTRKDAVDRLQKTIVWVFGVYTSISFASVLFGEKKSWESLPLIFFGLGFFFLIVAYWVATASTFSVPKDFFANSEDSVKKAYLDVAEKNKEIFYWSLSLSGVGTLLYSLALLLQFSIVAPPDQFPSMSLNCIKVRNSDQMITFDLNSKRSSWHEVILVHDTTIKNKVIEDTIPLINIINSKSMWLHSDSTGNARFTITRVKNKMGTSLLVFRTDSVKTDQLLNTKRLKFKIN